MMRFGISLAAFAIAAPAVAAPDPAIEKQRLIVLSDIEAEADDSQSLIRLLLYANEIDLEGLIATTSIWLKSDPQPETMRRILAGYGSVQPNLARNAPGYPGAAQLLALVRAGQTGYGMASVARARTRPARTRSSARSNAPIRDRSGFRCGAARIRWPRRCTGSARRRARPKPPG
jgi:Protein of unknown function (DUF1593)